MLVGGGGGRWCWCWWCWCWWSSSSSWSSCWLLLLLLLLLPLPLLSGSAVQQMRAGGTRRESMVAVGVGGVAMRVLVSLSWAWALGDGEGDETREGWPELESRAGVTDMARVLACSECFPLLLLVNNTSRVGEDQVAESRKVAGGAATGGIVVVVVVVNTRSGSLSRPDPVVFWSLAWLTSERASERGRE